MIGWTPCAISRKIIGILQHGYLCLEAAPDHHRCMFSLGVGQSDLLIMYVLQ